MAGTNHPGDIPADELEALSKEVGDGTIVNANVIHDEEDTSFDEDTLVPDVEEGASGQNDEDFENGEHSYRENAFENLNALRDRFPDKELLWAMHEDKQLGTKSIYTRLTFPNRRVSSFLIIKQLTISWKIRPNKYSPWKLHLQLLLCENAKKQWDTVVRVIWSRDGKYFHRMSAFMRPEIAELILEHGKAYKFYSTDPKDYSKPF